MSQRLIPCLLLLLLFGAATPSHATVLFLDTYSTSDSTEPVPAWNINFERDPRQSGTLKPVGGATYSEAQFVGAAEDFRTQVNNSGLQDLLLAPGGVNLESVSINQVSVSPDLDLSSVPANQAVTVAFTLDPFVGNTTNTEDWGMMRFGLSNAERTDSAFNGDIDGGGLAFLVRSNGGVIVFNGGGVVSDAGEDAANASRQGITSVILTLSNLAGVGTATLNIGGTLVDFDTTAGVNTTLNYTALGGGYMQLVSYSDQTSVAVSRFDSLQVSVVPEPSSLALLLFGSIGLWTVRRSGVFDHGSRD